MSLIFGANTSDRGDCGSNAVLDDIAAFTVLMWPYFTTLTADRTLVSKYRGSLNQGWMIHVHTTTSELRVEHTRATTGMAYVTSGAGVAVNRGTFAAFSIDKAASPPAHIYVGHDGLNGDAVEPSYATSQAGSGAFSSDAARSLFWGNRDLASPNQAMQGRHNYGAVVARIMTLDEIRQWQYEPSPLFPNTVDFHEFGVAGSGTSNQPDLSGNGNTCAMTGTTLGAHLALPTRRQVHTLAALQRAGSW